MEKINAALDSKNLVSITETRAIMAPMIGKDYCVINELNNKFILRRIALIPDDMTKHLPAERVQFRAIFTMAGGIHMGTAIPYSINLCFN